MPDKNILVKNNLGDLLQGRTSIPFVYNSTLVQKLCLFVFKNLAN